MKLKWSRKTDEEGMKELINILFCGYIGYVRERGYNLSSVEYERNILPIINSGLLEEETLNFTKYDLENIKEELRLK